ncbi:MAG: ABC transporter permease [Acidobacteriaceae bacterium]|nr:ABC transporter permease [Acidobacteriaceae bacterium]
MMGFAWAEQILQDIHFGVRSLRKTSGFATSAILSLALGIGATTAIFSVIYGVILDPFPYSHPETLVSFYANIPSRNFYFQPETPNDYIELKQNTHVFSDLISSTISDVVWTGTGEPLRLRGNYVTVNTFQVMGVKPQIGRYITPGDGEPQAPAVAVLGYKFWMRQFGGDPNVIGREMRLNDKVRTIVGVMPRRFMWRGADVYLPIVFQRGRFVEDVRFIFIMGRLKPGATEAEAKTDLHPIFEDMITRSSGEHVTKFRIVVNNFYETFPSDIRQSLWILFGAVGVLLLIACVNVSSLLLARSAARGRELAVRASLGAGRLRLVRQLLTESTVIGIAAGALGVLFAYGGLHAILSIVPPNTIPDESVITLNLPVLLFTLAVSLSAALLFGLAPAFHAGRADVAGALKSGGRGVSGAFGEARLRNIFVIAEVALATILLVGASLMIRTLFRIEQIQVGTQPEHVLSMEIPLPDRRYATRGARNTFFLNLLDRVRRVPGVESVALNQSVHPFVYFGTNVTVPASAVRTKTRAVVSQISSGYPEIVNARLLQGRLLTPDEIRSARRFAVVNEKFAKFFFPKGNALGQAVQLLELHPPPDTTTEAFEIVGVVGDLPNRGLQRETSPEVYIPFTMSGYAELSAILLVKSAVPVMNLVKPIEAQIHGLDPDQPVMEVRSLRQWLDMRGYSEPRFSVFLFGVFASLGLLLAALGIYAVINYSVLRQTQEIGVRVALGAQRSRILSMVVGSGAKLLGIGAVFGLVGSISTAYFLRSMIWGVSPFDPVSFGAVIAVLFAIGLLACVRPALRASRVDPIEALRYE